MNQIKIARYEETIKQILNHALNYEINNKIARNATVTCVKLTNDLSYARVYLDCLHRENIDKIIINVKKVNGFLRAKVSEKLNIYKTPQLIFLADKTIDYANKIDMLLSQIKQEEKNGKEN